MEFWFQIRNLDKNIGKNFILKQNSLNFFLGVIVDSRVPRNNFLRRLETLEMLENGQRLKKYVFQGTSRGVREVQIFSGTPQWVPFHLPKNYKFALICVRSICIFVNSIFRQFSLSPTKSSYFYLFYQTNFSKMVINTQEHCFWGPRTITISKIQHRLGLSANLTQTVFVYLYLCICVFVLCNCMSDTWEHSPLSPLYPLSSLL